MLEWIQVGFVRRTKEVESFEMLLWQEPAVRPWLQLVTIFRYAYSTNKVMCTCYAVFFLLHSLKNIDIFPIYIFLHSD